MKSLRSTSKFGFAISLLGLAALALGACGGGGGGSGPAGIADASAPQFGGVRSVAVAGGAFVGIAWRAAEDETSAASAITYRVYASATSGAQDFMAPVTTTGAGATSLVLSSATTPLVAVGADVFLVVRATDAAGNQETNRVEIVASPVAASAVAFVSDLAGGAGTLGDPADPFLTIQAGVAAVEGNGGGAVLVDAAAVGTPYAEEVNLTVAVTSIGLYGGFARFSSLPAAPTGGTILASRDVATNKTFISGMGLLPMVMGDLVRVDNSSSPTYIDGFHFDALRPVVAPLTGTLSLNPGATVVDGAGTLFGAEVPAGTVIQLDGAQIPVRVSSTSSDTRLFLDGPYRGPAATGAASSVGAAELFLQAVNAFLQLSCCSVFDGAPLAADTTAVTDASTVRLIGNDLMDGGDDGFRVGGGLRHLRVQNNRVSQRSSCVTADDSASGFAHVLAAGTDIVITNNLLERNREFGASDDPVAFSFSPADAGNGGALSILGAWNEIRNNAGRALEFAGVGEVGLNGSALVVVRDNLLNGSGHSQVFVETQIGNGAPFAGVDIDIRVDGNLITNGDNIPVDIDVGVSAGRRTTLAIRDNLIGVAESEAADVVDEVGAVLGDSDGGVFDLSFMRNTMLGGVEDVEFQVGVTHGGLTKLTVVENTVISSEDEGFAIDLQEYVGTTGAVNPFPDGVYCLNVFNNDVEAHDDEPYEIFDRRDFGAVGSIAIGYVGHGFNFLGSDPSDGALTVGYQSNDSAWLVERNFGGMGGADGTEVGIELDSRNEDVRNQVRVLNNVCTLGSGGGIEWHGGCWGQMINNTCAYNGGQQSSTNPEAGFEFNNGIELGDSQALVLNCIASHTGGQDIDYRNGVRPTYTLVRDLSVPNGIGNLLGVDPFYASDLNDLVTFAPTHQEIQTLYQVLSTSPTIDAGHPSPAFNDPDGTRNNMGAYGGPAAGAVGVKAAGTALPLVYVGTFPAVHLYAGAILPPDTQVLRFGFTRAVDPASLTAGITVSNGGAAVAGAFTTEAEGHVVVFTPTATLGAGPLLSVSFNVNLMAASGAALDYPWTERFGIRPAGPVAESEPNDDGVAGVSGADLAAAQSTGIGPVGGTFEIASSISAATDVDAYSFTAAIGSRIMVTTLNQRLGLPADGLIRLDLYDAAGFRITEGRRDNFRDTAFASLEGDAYLDHVCETAGTYYVVVSNTGAGAPPQPYTLMGVLD